MTNAAKIEANEAVVVPNTPHDLVPEGFRAWKQPAMPVLPVEEDIIPKSVSGSSEIPRKKRPLVYLAGPYTKGDKRKNVAWQAELFTQLVDEGFVWPYSPLTETEEPDLIHGQSHETWMQYSYEVLSRCDAVYRTAAIGAGYRQWESVGADLEVAYAEQHGIQVFFHRDELYEWAKNRQGNTSIRTFATGATRNLSTTKINPAKCLSPLVIQRYAEYMRDMRKQKDGTLRADDNWQKGISLESFMESGQRHSLHWWMIDAGHKYLSEDDGHEIDVEEACCALMFNVMGYLHERLKLKSSYVA